LGTKVEGHKTSVEGLDKEARSHSNQSKKRGNLDVALPANRNGK